MTLYTRVGSCHETVADETAEQLARMCQNESKVADGNIGCRWKISHLSTIVQIGDAVKHKPSGLQLLGVAAQGLSSLRFALTPRGTRMDAGCSDTCNEYAEDSVSTSCHEEFLTP